MRGLISKVLSPAVQLWLRSQVESVEELQFLIEGGDRQMLAGYIPKVTIAAQKAVYQGLHLSRASLTGEEIRVNLSQVIQGKPLRLLDAVPISGEVILQQDDLNASLRSPLLTNALSELLITLLRMKDETKTEFCQDNPSLQFINAGMNISDRQLTFSGAYQTDNENNPIEFALRTALSIQDGRRLRLEHPQWRSSEASLEFQALQHLQGFEIDLGSEVHLQELTLGDRQLICRGRINVNP